MNHVAVLRALYQREPWPFALALLALLVFLPAFDWGVPAFTGPDRCHAWGNDDQVPLAPLADAHNAFIQAKPDWNTAYPWFNFLLLGALYAPYLAYLRLTGGMGTPSGAFPFGLQDPVAAFTVLTYIGRSLSLVLSLAMVVAAYLMGKYLFDRATGLLTALIALLLFPVGFYARVGNPDGPALGWMALALAVYALCVREGLTVQRGFWLALFTVFTLCTKEQHGAALVLPFSGIVFWSLWRGSEQTWRHWRGRWVAPLLTSAMFGIAFLLASGAVITPARFARHMGILSTSFAAKATFPRYPATLAGYGAQVHDLFIHLQDSMGWPLLAAAALGVVLVVWRRAPAASLLLATVFYLLLLVRLRFNFLHYVLPAAFTLAPFSAHALLWLGRKNRAGLLVAGVAGALGLGLLALQTVDLLHDMQHDSRADASAWFREHAPAGSTVLFFGSKHMQPNLAADIRTIKMELREQALATITGERPDYIVIQPDNTTFERGQMEWRDGRHSVHSWYVPDEVYDQLAAGGFEYKLVAQFQSPRLLPWLDRPFLSYPAVNIPVQVFARADHAAGAPVLTAWREAPHNPGRVRVRSMTRERLEREFAQPGARP